MPHRMRRPLILLLPLLAALAVAPLRADRLARTFLEAGGKPLVEHGTPVVNGCAGGQIHDDGVPENGYGWNNTVVDGRYVDRFTPASYPFRYGTVCLCWVRQGSDDTIAYDVIAYDDDGPSGTPGTLLGSVPAVASGVPTALPGAFYTVDLSTVTANVTSGSIYLGARWNASVEQGFYLCADESSATPLAGGEAWSNVAPWVQTTTLFPNYRALQVQAGEGTALIEVPTLDHVGLAALLAALAASALFLLRRRTA
ncbi:MAG: hypothetical protein IPJ17_05585 [Holophagales bacterium]|nr:MAG: hypothetical protein IPJ17_05585 [Holophagales bacterium]